MTSNSKNVGSGGGGTQQGKKDVSPHLQKWLDTPNQAQYIVIERFSRLVGRALSILESAMPEGQQLTALKKLIESEIYEKRNDLLEYFKDIKN